METFIERWYFGNLDGICINYQYGNVSDKSARDFFKKIFNMIDNDTNLSKKTKDKFYKCGDGENNKDCEKFLPY